MLKRVSIQNFKSLKDVTLDLQKVNLLIGPNNSGKTNFLKALEFCGHTIKDVHQIKALVSFAKNERLPVKIQLRFSGKGETYTKEPILNELIEINLESENSPLNHFYEIHNNEKRSEPFKDVYTLRDRLIGKPIIYKPDPNKLTQPASVGEGAETVNADASNLVAFLDNALGEYRVEVFDRIALDLTKCVREFTEINLQNVKPTDELIKLHDGKKTFKRLGLTHRTQKVKYWADELSEGTLYFLALLCIINQPNPPKLLLLEEPEKGIHPRRLFEVMQFILTLVEEKDVQVIMTTHSPAVVDMFKDMPESVFIFDKDEEGATHVKNLQRDVIEPETARSKELGIEPPHYTDSLGDAWTVGLLGGVPK